MSYRVEKIISGGQTGVDRAALDFAIQNNIACGGRCPKGRLAEDGRIDDKYPLTETNTTLYVERTKRNVKEGDGTLILYSGELGNGSAYTAKYAQKKKKPLLVIRTDEPDLKETTARWIENNRIKVLNIAGPRESTSPGIYNETMKILEMVFKK